MATSRYARIQALFNAALDLPQAQWSVYLEQACDDDPDLRREVLAMLQADLRGNSLLESDVAHLAYNALDEPLPQAAWNGKEIGPYRLESLLGEGGMGLVYLARREDLDSLAAIKLLRHAWLSPARSARFAAEQRMLARLNHPHIARLYDADTLAEGTPWFAMEYVEGMPITAYCRSRNASIAERLQVLRQVCEAVQYVHGLAIIHRDLKPSNILVTADGAAKLLDFGIAKQLQTEEGLLSRTRTELRMMTPAYAAPEQIRGETVGSFTDVYALGVVLYELLTGSTPFDLSNCTAGEAERIILEREPPRPSQVAGRAASGGAAWADLDVLCLTAMHKDPACRYRSVEALIRDIDHYLRGEPLEARPDTLAYRAGKFLSRNRRPVWITGAALAAASAIILFFVIRLDAEHRAALASGVRAQRVQRFMQDLFEGGDRAAGPAKDLRVVTVLDRGVAEAQVLAGEPEVQADLYLTLGRIYQKLGKPQQAESLLDSALAKWKAIDGREQRQVAECEVGLGLLRVEQAKYEEAERLIRDGLAKWSAARPRNPAAIARANTALGKALEARGAYDKAIPVLEQAVAMQSGGAAPAGNMELAATLKELADVQFYAGHLQASESLTRRALEMDRALLGPKHPRISDGLINLGAIQLERGHYAEAEQYYREALPIVTAWYGMDHPETASTLSMLGRALVLEKRFDQATDLLRQALAIQERVYGPDHPKVANVINELGSVALQRDRYDEAEAFFRRMQAIYQKAYGDKHYLTVLALTNMASVFMARGDNARAEPMFREAVEAYSRVLSPDHANTGIARVKLGRVLLRLKRYPEAEEQILAGYSILSKQTSPSVSWLKSARKDLVSLYEATRRPEKASQFRDPSPATPAQAPASPAQPEAQGQRHSSVRDPVKALIVRHKG